MKLYGYFEVAEYEPGQSIFRQGDDVDAMLLVQRGSCVCTFEGEPTAPRGEQDRIMLDKEREVSPDVRMEASSSPDVLLRRKRNPASRLKVQLAVLGSGQIIGAQGPVLGIHRGIYHVMAVDSVRAFLLTAERLKTLQHELSWSLNLRETLRIWGEEANLFQKWIVKAISSNPRISIPSDFKSMALGQAEKKGGTAGSVVAKAALQESCKIAEGRKALQKRNEIMRSMAAKHDKWTRATFIDYSLSTKRGHLRFEAEQIEAAKPHRKMRAGRLLLPDSHLPITKELSVSFADSGDVNLRIGVKSKATRFSLSTSPHSMANPGLTPGFVEGWWSVSDLAAQGILDVGQRAKALAAAYAPPDVAWNDFPERVGHRFNDLEALGYTLVPVASDTPRAVESVAILADAAKAATECATPHGTSSRLRTPTDLLLQESDTTSPVGDWLVSERNVHAQWHTKQICRTLTASEVAGSAPLTGHIASTHSSPDDRWRRPVSTELIGRSCTTVSAPTRGLLDSRGLRSAKGLRSSSRSSCRVSIASPVDTCRLARPATTENAVRRLYPSSSRQSNLATCSQESGRPWHHREPYRDPHVKVAHLSRMLSPERTIGSPCADALLSAPAGHVQWQTFRPKAPPQLTRSLIPLFSDTLRAEMSPIHKIP